MMNETKKISFKTSKTKTLHVIVVGTVVEIYNVERRRET